jgi:hypothetical protein
MEHKFEEKIAAQHAYFQNIVKYDIIGLVETNGDLSTTHQWHQSHIIIQNKERSILLAIKRYQNQQIREIQIDPHYICILDTSWDCHIVIVYIPWHSNQRTHKDRTIKSYSILQQIITIMSKQYQTATIIIGDFNIDLSSTRHSSALQQALQASIQFYGMTDIIPEAGLHYTFHKSSKDNEKKSKIDYILISSWIKKNWTHEIQPMMKLKMNSGHVPYQSILKNLKSEVQSNCTRQAKFIIYRPNNIIKYNQKKSNNFHGSN